MSDSEARRYPARRAVLEEVNRPPIVFLTVCVKGRRHLLATEQAHELLLEAWGTAKGWVVGRYVVLPDHVHLFCAPEDIDEAPDLRRWVQYWKSLVSRGWQNEEEKPLWQKDCWDRQLRSGESYAEKWEYVRSNPVRHGLVERIGDWIYAGEVVELEW